MPSDQRQLPNLFMCAGMASRLSLFLAPRSPPCSSVATNSDGSCEEPFSLPYALQITITVVLCSQGLIIALILYTKPETFKLIWRFITGPVSAIRDGWSSAASSDSATGSSKGSSRVSGASGANSGDAGPSTKLSSSDS